MKWMRGQGLALSNNNKSVANISKKMLTVKTNVEITTPSVTYFEVRIETGYALVWIGVVGKFKLSNDEQSRGKLPRVILGLDKNQATDSV
jgi:hypothetical protein